MMMCGLLPVILYAAWPSAEAMALYQARRHGALAKEILHVVDQDGRPVVGAKIWGGLQTGGGRHDSTPLRGSTDTNGEYVVQGKCTNIIRCGIRLEGYYETDFMLIGYGNSHSVRAGKWQPYGTHHTVVLKKMINPQPLVCHLNKGLPIPAYDKWLGFDFEKHDFVSPHGKGVVDDMLLRFTLRTTSHDDYHTTMEVSFTNNPFAGAYELPKYKMSEFKSVYHADTNASYRQSFFYRYDCSPGKGIDYRHLTGDNYLVFRTRTKVDSEGRLVSAHYGKIYGDWHIIGVGGMRMQEAVFNPTPNDTNLEDLHTADRSRRNLRTREEIQERRLRKKGKKKKRRKSSP